MRIHPSPPRLGLIGCGAATRSYYVPALKALPGIGGTLRLVDRNLTLAREVATELGTSRYTDNYHDILDQVDGVIIAVPHSLHYPIAMDCLQGGLHVLCEKPLAETGAEVKRLISLAEHRGVTLSVNNTRRFFPSFRRVKDLISRGSIGRPRSIRLFQANKFEWPSATSFYVNPKLSSKGVLLDEGAHALDLVCWWTGGRPELISYEDDSFGGPESVARLLAERDGCHIDVTLNRLIDGDSRYLITGDTGSLECHPYRWQELTFISTRDRRTRLRLPARPRLYHEFVTALLDNFLDVIRGRAQPLIPARDVTDSINLIEECYNTRTRFSLPWYENLRALVQ